MYEMVQQKAKEKSQKRNTLGRGLSALIPTPVAPPEQSSNGAEEKNAILQLPIERIVRDEAQPRQHFETEKLTELAQSIKSCGIIQPITVRPDGANYRIVAGERRWRAAQLAGLKEVPAIVKQLSERDAYQLALIENLQREDLNPIEEAEGYRRLIDDHDLTQEAIANVVGKDRSSVANALRLLNLPPEIKQALSERQVDMGHARALLGLGDHDAMRRAFAQISTAKMSVRATEQLVRRLKEGAPIGAVKKPESPEVKNLTEQLQRAVGTKVRILDKNGKGRIELDYYSYAELDRILEHLMPTTVR